MRNVDGLKRMLNQFHNCLGMLNAAEVNTVSVIVNDLDFN